MKRREYKKLMKIFKPFKAFTKGNPTEEEWIDEDD